MVELNLNLSSGAIPWVHDHTLEPMGAILMVNQGVK